MQNNAVYFLPKEKSIKKKNSQLTPTLVGAFYSLKKKTKLFLNP